MNHLVSDGVIENYAVGGAIGASFYLPAMQTEDVDIFVLLNVPPDGAFTVFQPALPNCSGFAFHRISPNRW
jgi:hypothetical protein